MKDQLTIDANCKTARKDIFKHGLGGLQESLRLLNKA